SQLISFSYLLIFFRCCISIGMFFHSRRTLIAPSKKGFIIMKAFIGNSLIAKLKPQDKAYDVWDDKLTGFIVRVYPSGNMVYRCEYARGKRITLGKTGVLTPAQARDRAREILA